MAKKESKSTQASPVETVSGVEYDYLVADHCEELAAMLNARARDGWRLVSLVDRPQYMRAWVERGVR